MHLNPSPQVKVVSKLADLSPCTWPCSVRHAKANEPTCRVHRRRLKASGLSSINAVEQLSVNVFELQATFCEIEITNAAFRYLRWLRDRPVRLASASFTVVMPPKRLNRNEAV
jgi:hypothetical protein